MTTGHSSAADTALLDQLRAAEVTVAGKPITSTKLRNWRRHGLIDAPETTSRGRHGRVSTYAPEVADQVAQVAGWLTESRNLTTAVLAAFGLGRNPPEQRLREAYLSYFERGQDQANALIDSTVGLEKLARDLFRDPSQLGMLGPYVTRDVRAAGHPARDELSGQTITAAQLRQARLAEALSLLADGAESAQELAGALGLDELLAAATQEALPSVMAALAEQPLLSPQEMLEALANTEYAALQRRRSELLTFVRAGDMCTQLGQSDRHVGLTVALLTANHALDPEEHMSASSLLPGDRLPPNEDRTSR